MVGKLDDTFIHTDPTKKMTKARETTLPLKFQRLLRKAPMGMRRNRMSGEKGDILLLGF